MTNDRAVEVLKAIIFILENDYSDEVEEAIHMAINALTAQPEKTQLSEEDATSDCISRQAVLDAIFSEPLYKSGMKKRDADIVVPAIYEKIKALPPSPSRPQEPHTASLETPCDDCDFADKCTRESNCTREAIWKAGHEGGAV